MARWNRQPPKENTILAAECDGPRPLALENGELWVRMDGHSTHQIGLPLSLARQ